MTNSIHMLRNTSIKIPENLKVHVWEHDTMKIGYDDLAGRVLLYLAPRNGSGSHRLVAEIEHEEQSSAAYAQYCRQMAEDKPLLSSLLEKYVADNTSLKAIPKIGGPWKIEIMRGRHTLGCAELDLEQWLRLQEILVETPEGTYLSTGAASLVPKLWRHLRHCIPGKDDYSIRYWTD